MSLLTTLSAKTIKALLRKADKLSINPNKKSRDFLNQSLFNLQPKLSTIFGTTRV